MIETISYTLGAQFADLVANGEIEGLTPDEIQAFENITQDAKDRAPERHEFFGWVVDPDSFDDFSRCEATELFGNTYEFAAMYRPVFYPQEITA